MDTILEKKVEDTFNKNRRKQTVINYKMFHAIVDCVIKSTEKWGKLNGYNTKIESPKIEKFSKILGEAHHTVPKETISFVQTVLEEILETEIPLVFGPVQRAFNIVVVTNKNPNSHSYPLYRPILTLYGRDFVGIMGDGYIGNHLPSSRESVSPATPEQIVELLGQLLVTGVVYLEEICRRNGISTKYADLD